MAVIKEIVFDCEAAPALARFWATLLDGYAVRAYDDEEVARLATLGLTPDTDPVVMIDGPGPSLCFQQVPGRDYRNNRIHLDIAAPNPASAIRRMVELGGAIQREAAHYTVMRDPEGNQFCVVRS